jgi:hypothetical protein
MSSDRFLICVTCGVQYDSQDQPPERCAICEDERQWVRHEGQAWTTQDALGHVHKNVFKTLEPGLTEIVTTPKFAIGQRALFVQTPNGNVLWDCVSLIDEATIEAINDLGGISALAMSHPHMYGGMVSWSQAFGNVPIYLHAASKRWVMRPDPVIEFWDGDSLQLDQGVTLQRCGGHFTGSTVLHWPAGAAGRGVLLSSDTLYVTWDRRYVTFMYSYPNYIPLSASAVDGIVEKIDPFDYDRIYSHFTGLVIDKNAKEVVSRSVARYKKAIGG